MEKKIRTIEQSRFLKNENLRSTTGGSSCDSSDVFFQSCNLTSYTTCAPSVSYGIKECYLHMTCGDVDNGLYLNCISDNSKVTCVGQFLCGGLVYGG